MAILYVKPWLKSFPLRARIASKVLWSLFASFGLEDLAGEDGMEDDLGAGPLTAIEQIRIAKRALEISTILCSGSSPDDSRLDIVSDTLMDSGPEIVFGFATISQIQLEAVWALAGITTESLFESVGAILAAMEMQLIEDPTKAESFRLPTLMMGATDSNGNPLTAAPAPIDNRLLFQIADENPHPSEGPL